MMAQLDWSEKAATKPYLRYTTLYIRHFFVDPDKVGETQLSIYEKGVSIGCIFL